MISSSDSYTTVSLKNYYAILPAGNKNLIKKFIAKNRCKKVDIILNIQAIKMVNFYQYKKLKN